MFQECGLCGTNYYVAGGVYLMSYNPNCHSSGGMDIATHGTVLLSDCLFSDCFVSGYDSGTPGLDLSLWGKTPTHIARLSFTDSQTLTVQDCSFVECSSNFAGAAFYVFGFGSCGTGAILLRQPFEDSPSISLTRVVFINNSVGHARDMNSYVFVPDDTPAFVDVSLTIRNSETKPTLSFVDCFTTCAIASMGMGVNKWISYDETLNLGVDDDAFDNVGPRLTERVELSVDGLSGRMELGMKGKIPIASQKYEVRIRNEVDKTEMKEVIEFLDGRTTLKSPSPTFNLDFSTSYTITSIVGIVPSSPSSSSSLSNVLSFPLVAWTFNLDSNPSFFSFTTPTPPTLVGATARLVSSDQPLAFIILVFDRVVSGSYCLVIEEEGKDVNISVNFDESAVTGGSSDIVVVGEDRLLTHDTTYTIKEITPTVGTESPFVRMNGTISFHIPKSSYVAPTGDNKKAMSAEMKKLLSRLIPLVVIVP
ncbi:hypothetical protein BLNAU_9850 [Blattamonas nauphoetae]|uniref:Uncharacterized protein n=1 Tax=Blattamonas nauphoetae TaxID=2049346 RepID=A0ABQ9XUF1_9EUKA|nr:hypothetical protein BLNAU_9850 [Blattamonas nauphoetae]